MKTFVEELGQSFQQIQLAIGQREVREKVKSNLLNILFLFRNVSTRKKFCCVNKFATNIDNWSPRLNSRKNRSNGWKINFSNWPNWNAIWTKNGKNAFVPKSFFSLVETFLLVQIGFEKELESRTKRQEMQLSALKENLATVRTELKSSNEKLALLENIRSEKTGQISSFREFQRTRVFV